jgi:hypothetical protein
MILKTVGPYPSSGFLIVIKMGFPRTNKIISLAAASLLFLTVTTKVFKPNSVNQETFKDTEFLLFNRNVSSNNIGSSKSSSNHYLSTNPNATCSCENVSNPFNSSYSAVDLKRTTCSAATHALGDHQKVVAFSFFEGSTYDNVYKRDYFAGIR